MTDKPRPSTFLGASLRILPDLPFKNTGRKLLCKIDLNSELRVQGNFRQLLEPHNTPFTHKSPASAVRRLWTYLVHQEAVQDIFIRAVFGKRRSISMIDEDLPSPEPAVEPVRIIHKEQDSIAAFSLNQVIFVMLYRTRVFSALVLKYTVLSNNYYRYLCGQFFLVLKISFLLSQNLRCVWFCF